MTRILSYNILAGGYNVRENGTKRTQQLLKIMKSAQPDIIGIVEATNPIMKQPALVIEEIAEALGMQLVVGAEATHHNDFQLALLTRLPILHTKIHHSARMIKKPLLEVGVEDTEGQPLTVFVTHLTAAFSQRRAGGYIRLRESSEIIKILAPLRQEGRPHLLMGDFNSLAPGDPFKAHFLLRYITQLDQTREDVQMIDGHPQLNTVIPPRLRFLKPIARLIPYNELLSTLFDGIASLYAHRGAIKLLQEAGYIDCFRQLHPHAWGFTCPAAAPAGRIDYIFASPDLAERLEMCCEITVGGGLPGSYASDHLPVAAMFGPRIQPTLHEQEREDATIDAIK